MAKKKLASKYYVKKKIQMLEEDMQIELTPEEKEEMYQGTEITVDRLAHTYIMERL